MHSKKRITSVQSIIIFLLITCSAQTAQGKSVYVITNIGAGTVKAYDIQDDQIQYQATAENLQRHGDGAVGLALDPDSQILFVTYEGSNIIEMVNAKTMISEEKPVTVPSVGLYGLAGIAFDQEKQKLYVVDRRTDKLFVYLWDPVRKTLTLEGDTYKTLANLSGYGAYGIALDESADRLYVTNATNTVCRYDTNDPNFGYDEVSIDIVVNDNARQAVGIAIDSTNHCMYTGMFHGTGGYHNFLVRTDINDINNPSFTENDIGAYVIGIAADQDTGLVYVTTYENRSIEVYNPDNWPSDPCDVETSGILGPAGICLAGNCSYKPSVFDLVKDDNDVNCASPLISEAEHELLGTPYNWLYYKIEYDANGYADTNVIITDYLPAEVNYISSDPCGVYDSNWHTVTWDINDISASDSNILWIQVGVNYYAKPGDTIINLCEMESDRYYKFTTKETTICCYGGYIIYVDKDANAFNNGTSWLDAYRDLQDAFLDANNCGCNQIRVAEGTYKPTDINDTSARLISFELLDDVAFYGGFPPGGGTWFERNPSTYETILSGDIGTPNDLSDNSYHVVKCEDVNNAILDGFTITAGNANAYYPDEPNQCGGGIYCKDSNHLTVAKCIIIENEAGADGGGIYFKDSTSLTLTDCNISDNSSYCGGALYNESSETNINNCFFSGNLAMAGGGMYNHYEPSPTVVNCTFNGNTVYWSGHSTYGGGICNDQSSPTLINCTFNDNSAPPIGVYSYGGAICNWDYSNPNVTNCIFNNNSAYDGGGICNWNDSNANVNNCTFSNNSAYEGGGVCNYDSDPNITNCIFNGNTTVYYGGGILNCNYSDPNISNCIFSGNSAGYGGGIENWQSYPTVTNCTFSGNFGDYGGGMHNGENSVPNVTNCIFWDNVATVENEIYNDENSDPDISYSDIKGGWAGTGNIEEDPCFFDVEEPTSSWTEDASYDSSTFQSTLTDAGANWSVNQLAGKFVNPEVSPYQYLHFFIVSNDVNTIKVWSNLESIAHEGDTYEIYDYHLSLDSACIDAGTNTPVGGLPTTDIDGEPRVFDGDANETEIVDMGADEYYWSLADFNSDGLVNFFDYALFANVWQKTPQDEDYNDVYDLVDNNCIDYNDLDRFCEDWLWQTAWAKAFPCSYGRGMGKSMGLGMSESLSLTEELYPSAPTKQTQPQVTEADIEEIIKWLVELWLTNDELRKMMSEDEWLKFIESVANSK